MPAGRRARVTDGNATSNANSCSESHRKTGTYRHDVPVAALAVLRFAGQEFSSSRALSSAGLVIMASWPVSSV